MPELPEVETIRRGLSDCLAGRRITSVRQRRADLRIPFPEHFVERIQGQRVLSVKRRAKYLLIELEDGTIVIAHLGMSGRFSFYDCGMSPRTRGRFHFNTPHEKGRGVPGEGTHDHVVFDLEGGTRVVFSDHRRFGLMTLAARDGLQAHPLLKDIGVEPLGEELTADYLARVFRNKKTSIKAALLDQRLIGGLGNIYVCEALYTARISPRRRAYTVAGRRARRLVAGIRRVLSDAIEAGGSTLRDYVNTDGEFGYFQHSFSVYDRAGLPCLSSVCTSQIKRILQSNRSTFFCSACQR